MFLVQHKHKFENGPKVGSGVNLILLSILLIFDLNVGLVSRGSAQSSVESLFGQVAKTFIYSGATLARFNSRLLCSLLGHETERDNDDQPTLFVFNNHLNREHAFRVYADDEITQSMVVEAGFDVNQMTYIFVHGWLGGIHNELWLSEAKNAALQSSLSRRYNPSQFYSGYDDEHDNSTNNITIINDRETTSKYFRENFVDLEERRGRQQESLFRPNVIIVDWSDFAQGTLYTATQNSFKVARRLGRLLSQLSTVGKLKPELMHCLGHSIGTHICGQAARQAFPPSSLSDDFISLEEFVSNLPGPALTSRSLEGNNNKKVLGGAVRSLPRQRMGRITALDPGGFCYELGIKNETTYRGLRPSDALLVDAYYSNRSPFGNKYQVATYNVRINNGFFQRPCSVWKNPEVASAYFRAAVRFTIGNIGHNDILTCDHYFATRFAHQLLPRSCSYVAYACDSYRNYLRGRCGLCNTPKQCYVMDFEYQRANASITNVKEQMLRYSTSMNDEFDQDSTLTDEQPLGGVPYGNRQIYYMKVDYDKPFCAITFRLRVNLDREVVDLRSFRSDWLKLRFYGREEEVLNVRDASTGKVTDALSVYGAWADNEEEGIRMEEEFGVDESTRTALFEIVSAVPALMDEKSMETNPIASVLVEYDNELHRRQDPLANPILSIRIDNMSSGDPNIRAKNSRIFHQNEFKIIYKHLASITRAEFISGNDEAQVNKILPLKTLKEKIMNYMLKDLNGCGNGAQKILENLSPVALFKPDESCKLTCNEDGLDYSGEHKYSGGAVVCCCSEQKTLTLTQDEGEPTN